MERARIVRQIGELLSSQAALRDAWPECSRALAALVGAAGAQIVPAEGDETQITPVDGVARLVVPLRFNGQLLGAMQIEGARGLDEESIALLEACAFTIGARLHFERFAQSSERLAELARVDPLTGIANRRRFDEVFESACARALQNNTPLCLAVIDIDYFKAYNDGYGHQAGDVALRHIASALEICARRPEDLLARYGGEEFVVLLPGARLDVAIDACESACEAVLDLELAHAGSSLGRVSISAGVAELGPGGTSDRLFHEADDALYRAKLGGRNRVAATGYVSTSVPAERVLPAGGSNLPEPPNALIGRARELRELAVRIAQQQLLTITGIGGAGKTRLAIEAASRALPHFEDGAWFVDFSAVADSTLVPSAVSALFDRARNGSVQELVTAIGHKHVLLVFDNCEHLLQPVAELAQEIVAACPRVHILATSRVPLSVESELLMPVQPLAIDDAVELFIERLRDADRSFTRDAAASDRAASICRRLDGIPLALELAAPRAASVGLARLEADLEPHPTMNSIVAWSCALLSDEEARIFRRLGIFAGGFRVDAAIEVCWDAQIDPAGVAAILERLQRNSLVTADSADARARLRLLETIRAYALERLTEHVEFADLRRRHAQWVLSFSRNASRKEIRRSARTMLALMSPEIDNFRAAVAWSLYDRGEVPLGCAIVALLLPFMHEFAPGEGTRWGVHALELLPPGTDPQIEGELCYGLAAMRQLPAQQVRAYAERAVQIFRGLGNDVRLSRSLRVLAQIIGWYFRAQRELADRLAIESIELARRSCDDPAELVAALRTRGLTIDISDFPAKRAVLEEALALARKHGLDRVIGGTLTWISEMEFSAGDHRRAYEYGREAVQVAESSGSRELYATAILNFAFYAAAAGEFEQAREAAINGLRTARATWQHAQTTYAVQALALVAAGHRDYTRAARLIGFCDARDGTLHAPRQADQSEDLTHRALLAQLRQELGEEPYEHHAEAGRALSEEEAAEEALLPLVRS